MPRATDGWAVRYREWQRVRLEVARACVDVIHHHPADSHLVHLLRSALVEVFSTPFLNSPQACVGRPVFRGRAAAREAGVPRTFRCVRCRRRHPGRLPRRYLQEI